MHGVRRGFIQGLQFYLLFAADTLTLAYQEFALENLIVNRLHHAHDGVAALLRGFTVKRERGWHCGGKQNIDGPPRLRVQSGYLADYGRNLGQKRLHVGQVGHVGAQDFRHGAFAHLLQGGQGVFGIAVSGAMRELTGAIADFPGERADGGESIAAPEDELASRRKQRDRKIG